MFVAGGSFSSLSAPLHQAQTLGQILLATLFESCLFLCFTITLQLLQLLKMNPKGSKREGGLSKPVGRRSHSDKVQSTTGAHFEP